MERLNKIGCVISKSAAEVDKSKLGIGFEKLDRAVFDPNKAYDKVAQLGVKWIRLQSGWARTEKEKGVYDFSWLDEIVDNLIRRGLKPWMCLAYGNGLYTPEANKVFGAVGCPPIGTDEEQAAWNRYVFALAEHYAGRVEHFEVWNEPNWFWTHIALEHQPDGTEYGAFVIRTAQAVKRANPNAKVIGGVESVGDITFINKAFQTGMGEYIDFFSYHIYTPLDKKYIDRQKLIRGMVDLYNPAIQLIQGETGAPSRSDGHGEISDGAWTQEKQAKVYARHAVTDMASEVAFSSYFSCMDMVEALGDDVNNKKSYQDYGYFGILAAEFDENGFASGNYTPKLSYKALQTIASVFADEVEPVQLPFAIKPLESRRNIGMDISDNVMTYGFKKPNGSYGFAYWYSSNVMTGSFSATISFETGIHGKPKLVDLLNGSVYQLPESMVIQKDGVTILKNIPINDYPLLLTFGSFLEISEKLALSAFSLS